MAENESYELNEGRPAIMTEIYLPAKYSISPQFLSALDDSLDPAKIRAHFSPEANSGPIMNCLPGKMKDQYKVVREQLLKSRHCFGGYSIYDLKGGWRNDQVSENEPPLIERDANMCLRLLDWPDILKLYPEDTDLCKQAVRAVFAMSLHHLEPSRNPLLSLFEGRDREKVANEVFPRINDWIDESSLLLYGFVMYHLIESTGGRESEILMTSHFEVVNQYRKKK